MLNRYMEIAEVLWRQVTQMIDETGLSTCINLIKCRFLDTN